MSYFFFYLICDFQAYEKGHHSFDFERQAMIMYWYCEIGFRRRNLKLVALKSTVIDDYWSFRKKGKREYKLFQPK